MTSLKAFDHPILKAFKCTSISHLFTYPPHPRHKNHIPEVTYSKCRGSQGDVAYLGWDDMTIAPSYMSDRLERKRQNVGWGGGGGGRKFSLAVYSCKHGAQLNFDDLTPYN
jgi:hypothetical protein